MSGNFRTFEKVCGEGCAERMIRRALHDTELINETPNEVYSAAVQAATEERNPNYGDVRNIERMNKRKAQRYSEIAIKATEKNSPAAAAFLHRLDMEMGVLDWAADELRAIVRTELERRKAEGERV